MFKKILIATDFSRPSDAAIQAGISLAKRCLARVELVHVVSTLHDLYHLSLPHVSYEDWKSQVQRKLDEVYPDRLYPAQKREVLFGVSTAPAILDYARKEDCDLIVAGSHGHTAAASFLMGSTTQKLARNGEIPVMVVRDSKHERDRYQGFDRVLIPSDLSDACEPAFEFGLNFANFLKADVHMIHVVDVPTIDQIQKTYAVSLLDLKEPSRLHADNWLQSRIESKRIVGNSFVGTLFGDPAKRILEYVQEKNIDFLIMGSHGRRGLDRILLGSVTAGVLAHATVPVIVLTVQTQKP